MHTEQCVYGLVVFGIVRVGHTLIAAKHGGRGGGYQCVITVILDCRCLDHLA